MRSNELYNEIIKNKGKKEEDWKKFAYLLGESMTIHLFLLI